VNHDESGARPRVLLAEDQPANLALLESLLDTEFDVVATVADGVALVDAAARLLPDAIVTDITMPRLDGLRAAQQILRSNPSARIVFVTVHADPTIVRRSMDVGGLGYVPKTVAGDELVPTVWAALRGERRCLCSL
jgi:DNA-binding NarL/FixJ family response regulator